MAEPILAELSDGEVYRQAFENSSEAAIVTDRRGVIRAANPAWSKLHGYSREEAVGQRTSLVQSQHSSREMYRYMWEQILDPSRGYWRGEIINRRKDGVEIPLELFISPLRNERTTCGYVGLSIDLTERKQLEELKRLYDMVVRHDLKSPLAVVSGVLDMTLSGTLGPVSAEQRDMLGRAQRQSRRMGEMISVSLDLEKLRQRKLALEPQPVDLFAALRDSADTVATLARDRRVAVELRRAGHPVAAGERLVLDLDPLHLQRCTDNLLKNAVEASPPGETVWADAEPWEGGARLRVHNGGPAIPPDVRATLFHAFGTYGKRGGTGLGLYGVKLLVEAMGGQVRCDTGAEGTTFELAFPHPAA